MRIEINAGGIGGGFAVTECQSNISGMVSSFDSIISSFKTVRTSTLNLPGGTGDLLEAVENIDARIAKEEEKKSKAIEAEKKANGFLELAIRVDKQVARLVNKNKDEFYKVNPWLKPVEPEEKSWLGQAWDWLCGTGEAIGEGLKEAWNWISDTARKAWDAVVEFYQEHKKIIDTILIIAGAVLAIAAVIVTGGLALAPLLVALGCSAGAAAIISGIVGVIAVVTTLASSSLNIVDIWCEIDDPTFNAWQKGLGWASAISNGLYSIGNLYNAFHGISAQDLKNFAKTLYSDGRYGYGSNGQVVEYLSDFYPGSDAGVQHGMGTQEFYSIDNASGGKIYVSTDPISQNDFASIVNNSNGNVNILSGTHGDIDGLFYPESAFYSEDYIKWAANPNVNVFDVTKLSPNELSLILNSPGTNICAWCFSERSRAVLSALGLI